VVGTTNVVLQKDNLGGKGMTVLETVENIDRAESAANIGKRALDPDENLLAAGLIDSLGVIKLIVSLEKAFGISVGDEDVVPENFQSLHSLALFVEQKQRNR
jgi:acyl carrier protein